MLLIRKLISKFDNNFFHGLFFSVGGYLKFDRLF